MRKCFMCNASDGDKKIISHHEQYETPEIIIDLCYSCHKKRHNSLRVRGINPMRLQPSHMVSVWIDPMTYWKLTELQKKWAKSMKRIDTVTEVIERLMEKNG